MIFKDKYFFLSPFFSSPIILDINGESLSYKNVEAAFQAHKNLQLADKFCLLSGLEAKKLGEQLKPKQQDWDTYQIKLMAKLQHIKFENPFLFNALKSIKIPIINHNYWGDRFWGSCKGKGLDLLGKILTFIQNNDNDYDKLLKYVEEELIPEYLRSKEDNLV